MNDETIRSMLERARTIAVVGLSEKKERDSHQVAAYLQDQGYRIIPVNPNADTILGEKAVSSLRDIDEPVDIVDVFRRREHVPPIAEEAADIHADALWLQLGIVHEEAERIGQNQGMDVVMDRCIKVDHQRLMS